MALVQREEVYYFRKRFPVDVASILGRVELCRSTGETQRSKAWGKAAKLSDGFEMICKGVRAMALRGAEKADIEKLVAVYLSDQVEVLEGALAYESRENVSVEELEAISSVTVDLLEKNEREQAARNLSRVSAIASNLLSTSQLGMDVSSENFSTLCHKILSAERRALEARLKSLDGDSSAIWELRPAAVEPVLFEGDGRPLSAHVDEYKEHKLMQGSWSLKSTQEMEGKLDVFLSFIADKPLHMIDSEDALAFQKLLHRLPKNFKTMTGTLVELADRAERERLDKLADKTIYKKYISAVRSFFTWMLECRRIGSNPFEYIKGGKRKADRVSKDERHPLSDEEMEIAFGEGFDLDTVPYPSHFWLPCIMLYTGMRPREVGQLLVTDIVKVDDVFCINVNDEGLEGKSVKTQSARRLIPIPAKLIEAGLLDHVGAMRAGGEQQLWPNFRATQNGYGASAAKWFNTNRLRKQGIEDPRKVLYSLRHTFMTKMDQMDVPEKDIKLVVGHERSGETLGRYSKGQSMGKLKAHMDGLDIPAPAAFSKLMRARNPKESR